MYGIARLQYTIQILSQLPGQVHCIGHRTPNKHEQWSTGVFCSLALTATMSSPAVDVYTVSSLFTVGSPSKSGQIEAIVVAALYFIPFCALTLQLPACKGKYHPVISTALFAAGMFT